MSKRKIYSLLVIFLILSIVGSAQNSKTLYQPEKTSGKDTLPGTSSVKKDAANDRAANVVSLNDTSKIKSSKNAEVIVKGKTHHIINKKRLRDARSGQADTSPFIYDLNAFYALGQ